MVMPRAFSSGAASIWSYALASPPNFAASTDVIAAVSVVLPWSTCPIVPTFTCGLVLANLPFAISISPYQKSVVSCIVLRSPRIALPLTAVRRRREDHNRTGLAERARYRYCLLRPCVDDRLGHVLRGLGVVLELHRVGGAALRHRAQRGRV